MSLKSQQVIEWRRRSRRRQREAFGNRCGICGYNRCSRALGFHHLDPQTKRFNFAVRGNTRSWKRNVEELRKCVLLCANCHMEVEDGNSQIPEDIQRFDESYATYVNDQGNTIGE